LAGRYTLLEQGPLDDLLPLCEKRGASIVVGGPLNSGILAGRDTWNYAPAPAEIVERVKRIQAVCDAHGVPLPAAAFQFPLAHPVVARSFRVRATRPSSTRTFRCSLTRSRALCGATSRQRVCSARMRRRLDNLTKNKIRGGNAQ
jgi:D-threo-aldose 1-dehydrogenase